jgi:DNA polymerase III psi subunit
MTRSDDIFYEILFSQPLYLIPENPGGTFANDTIQQPILVVVESLPLTTAEEELLHKILQAAKINPTEVDKIAITNYCAEENSHRNHILFFVEPKKLPKELAVFGVYCTVPIYTKANVIIANNLTMLATDTDGKKKLWELLKKNFLQ